MEKAFNTQETLLFRVQNNMDSWDEFTSIYERYIYLIIRAMKINHHDAEDLTQDVLLKVWKNIPNYEYNPNHARFRTWLSRICRNRVIDFVRKKKTDTNKVIKNHEDAELITQPQIEALAEEEWKAHVSTAAWDNIKNEFKTDAMSCFDMMNEGIPVADIAKQLNLSESSVYVYSKRVRDQLVSEVRRLNNNWN
ncbi:sigma-70 family RNA polymerase sigma factor [Lentisphaera marina]|uniref:RNA polymerase sigma factor n=1 Tax=Lentisphaera marina TaxID=1111041 RepID=UPI002365DDE9|nr:sigma-70 family RNA polymerase sigma factor [Lentisphaera marina]MDD7984391.1 sigma-70 family RNA polymerase sigma factor [Lentisphaera marina]